MELLGEYEPWITTAVKTSDPNILYPFDVKPLLVLTEDNDAQEEVFFNSLKVGAKLRLFGSAHTSGFPGKSREELAHLCCNSRTRTAPEGTTNQLSPLVEQLLGGSRRRRSAQCRRMDAVGRSSPQCARRSRAQTRLLDPFLHARRIHRHRESRLGPRL